MADLPEELVTVLAVLGADEIQFKQISADLAGYDLRKHILSELTALLQNRLDILPTSVEFEVSAEERSHVRFVLKDLFR